MQDSELLFQLLVPTNLAFFALVFLGVYFYEKRLEFMGWLGLGYLSGVLASLLDLVNPHSPEARLDMTDVANPLYWAIGIFVTLAMASRYRRPVPARTIGTVAAIGIAGQLYFGYFNYIYIVQEILANVLAAFFMFVAAWVVRPVAVRRIDRVVWMLFVAVGLSNLLRVTGIFALAGGMEWLDMVHLHNTVQLFASAIAANAGAMSLLVLGALDIVRIYRDEAITDPLTGLANRRGLEAELTKAEAETGLAGYSIIICDIDHFKRINDRFGHHVGDIVLRKMGGFLNQHADPFGFAARIGGEEFAIIVRPQGRDAVRVLADHMCLAFQHLQHPELSGAAQPTASFGIARIMPGESFTTAYKRADKALYLAKENGRNQVQESHGFAPAISNVTRLRSV